MNTIVGRVTQDAQIRTLANDKQVVNFPIAVNDHYKTKQGEKKEQTTFFNCAYWITPKVAEYLTVGTLVELSGKVSASAWTDKDGKAHSSLNFNTSKIKFHGGGKQKNTTTPQATPTSQANQNFADDLEDDLPF